MVLFARLNRQENHEVTSPNQTEISGTGDDRQPVLGNYLISGSAQLAEDGPLAQGAAPRDQKRVEKIFITDEAEGTACLAAEGTTAAEQCNPPTSLQAKGYGDETKQELLQPPEVKFSTQLDVSQVLKVRFILGFAKLMSMIIFFSLPKL